MRALALLSLLLFLALPLHAQQLDLFDPDDFVDPRVTRGQVIFISRLVTGVSRGYMDQFRRVGQDVGFVHLSNDLYWGGFQLSYKRSEVRGEQGIEREDPGRQFQRASAEQPPPVPGPKNVSQLSWYQTFGERFTVRYRLLYATQFAMRETVANVRGLDDRDETRMAQVDAGMRFGARTQYVTLTWSELTRHSTLDRAAQRTLTAGAYLPSVRLRTAVLVPRLQVGGVADEGPLIDIINPSADLSLPVPKIGAYLHAVYSPVYRAGELQHQVALYASRALIVLPRRP